MAKFNIKITGEGQKHEIVDALWKLVEEIENTKITELSARTFN